VPFASTLMCLSYFSSHTNNPPMDSNNILLQSPVPMSLEQAQLDSLHSTPLWKALRPSIRHRHLLVPIRVPAHRNIAHQLLKSVKEFCVHSPIPEITRALFKAPAERVGVLGGVEAEDLRVWIRPVEPEIITETTTELRIWRVMVVLEY
jgi:hypothetical protein